MQAVPFNLIVAAVYAFCAMTIVNAQCKVRKEIRNLSPLERRAMMDGFVAMEKDGTMERFRNFHADNIKVAHNNPNFALWHRSFGIDLENELLAHSTGLKGLPFHDISLDAINPNKSIAFTPEYFGILNNDCKVPFTSNGTCVKRLPVAFDWGACASTVLANLINTNTDYPALSTALEGTCHNQIHASFPNSTMRVITLASGDPYFFPFHAGIDRVLAQWQNVYSNAGNVDLNMVLVNKTISSLFTYSEGKDCYVYEGLAAPSSKHKLPPTSTTTTIVLNPQATGASVPSTNPTTNTTISTWIPTYHAIPRDWFEQTTFTPQQIDKLDRMYAGSIEFLNRAKNEGKKVPTLDDYKTVSGNGNWTSEGIFTTKGRTSVPIYDNTAISTKGSFNVIQGAVSCVALAFALLF